MKDVARNILAADIGGTKSWLALVQVDESVQQRIINEKIYSSTAFKDATELLETFIKDSAAQNLTISSMVLALPGIVTQDNAALTNLDWQLDRWELSKSFSIENVTFINDFQAAALGVNTLSRADYITLNEGQATVGGIKVVTGAGTGLGMAWLNDEDGRYQANSTEGGHIDFAPTSHQQIELLQDLFAEYEHVSYERLVSGDGFERIYQFLASSTEPKRAAKDIAERAIQGDLLAQQALTLFVEIYAAYVGNLALLFKPQGGIYLAGGIAAKILPWMQSESFMSSCTRKGRMQKLVEDTPIYLITNERLGLQGALLTAMQSS